MQSIVSTFNSLNILTNFRFHCVKNWPFPCQKHDEANLAIIIFGLSTDFISQETSFFSIAKLKHMKLPKVYGQQIWLRPAWQILNTMLNSIVSKISREIEWWKYETCRSETTLHCLPKCFFKKRTSFLFVWKIDRPKGLHMLDNVKLAAMMANKCLQDHYQMTKGVTELRKRWFEKKLKGVCRNTVLMWR